MAKKKTMGDPNEEAIAAFKAKTNELAEKINPFLEGYTLGVVGGYATALLQYTMVNTAKDRDELLEILGSFKAHVLIKYEQLKAMEKANESKA